MMKKYIVFLALIAVAAGAMLTAGYANAQDHRIAATVNGTAISEKDVRDRMILFFASTGTPPSQANAEKARDQVRDVLIEEELKMQEASRLDLNVTDEEVKEGFARLAAQNKLEAEQFAAAMAAQNIPQTTLERQIRSQLSWSKVVASYLRPQVNVTENDVNARYERIRSGVGEPEYKVSEIFLPVAEESNEDQIRQLAAKLIAEMQNNNAPFELVAAQFSKSANAAQGGDLGWVGAGDLPQELELVVRTMEPGQISPPVRGLSGYHILRVAETRTKTEETLPDENTVLNSIGLERLDQLQRRHLADLRAAAFIERRDV